MDFKQARERAAELRKRLNYHGYRYYVLGQPVISDREYDALWDELHELETEFPALVEPDSPTQRVGAEPAEGFVKVTHPAPILSLDKATSREELWAWQTRIAKLLPQELPELSYMVEPKFDGITVVLHYQKGEFTLGATRGNGEVGEDITDNLRTVRTLPLRIPRTLEGPEPPEQLVVRGEALIKLKAFERLNERLRATEEEPFANPRNAVAGTLRQLDSQVVAQRPIFCYAYDIVAADGPIPSTQKETLEYLHALGFPVAAQVNRHCENLDEVADYCRQMTARRGDLPYEADGLVIKIDARETRKGLGTVGGRPRGAIAYKFPPQEAITELLEVEFTVGRTGVITPTALLAPVQIGGVTVSRASLHNFDSIAEREIRVGDHVVVHRAGDVIPYVVGPLRERREGTEKPIQPPERCPVCDEPVSHLEGEVDYRCLNAECPAQRVQRLLHFAQVLDIEGLGERTAELLIDAGLLRNPAELYTLKAKDLLELEGFAEKKADNLLAAISSAKQRDLSRIITALGIRGVGQRVAETLAAELGTLQSVSEASEEQLTDIEGIGPIIAANIQTWFDSARNQNWVQQLRQAGVRLSAQQNDSQTGTKPLEGKTFVITGRLSKPRKEIKAWIERHGGKVTSSVSGNTDYLLLGEERGNTKYRKAEQLEVPIIGEEKLRAMVI